MCKAESDNMSSGFYPIEGDPYGVESKKNRSGLDTSDIYDIERCSKLLFLGKRKD